MFNISTLSSDSFSGTLVTLHGENLLLHGTFQVEIGSALCPLFFMYVICTLKLAHNGQLWFRRVMERLWAEYKVNCKPSISMLLHEKFGSKYTFSLFLFLSKKQYHFSKNLFKLFGRTIRFSCNSCTVKMSFHCISHGYHMYTLYFIVERANVLSQT